MTTILVLKRLLDILYAPLYIAADIVEIIKEKDKTTPTWLKLLAPVLAVGGLGIFAVLSFLQAFVMTAWFGNPLPVLGFDQSPDQPMHFPHTIHAGVGPLIDENTGEPYVSPSGEMRINDDGSPMIGLGMDCTYCHKQVIERAWSGVPPVELCISCHKVIGDSDSEQLTYLRQKGLYEETKSPINWERVHRMPDHVRFNHAPHIWYLTENPNAIQNKPVDFEILPDGTVNASKVCSTCHGNVAGMEQVAQVQPLKMGQCVACHRANEASVGCETCHH